jgi:hypothetical protein
MLELGSEPGHGGELEHPPWIGDNMENVNTQMTAITKGTGTARIKADLGGKNRGVRQSVHRWIADGGPSRVRNNL